LDDGVAWVGQADANPYRQATRHGRRLSEKTALAHPRATLDDYDGAETRENLIKVLAKDSQFGVAPADCLERNTPCQSSFLSRHQQPFANSGALSDQKVLPIGRDASGRPGHRLFNRVMVRRR
jgi:hypothetical protein